MLNVKKNIENRKIDEKRIETQCDFLIKNYGVQSNIDIFRKFVSYARLIKLLKINTDFILDLGSGFGTLTKCLALIGNKVDSLDHFKEALNFAKKNNNFLTNIEYICEDIYEFQLKKNKYDLVFASEFPPFTRNYYDGNDSKEKYHKKIITNIFNSLKINGHFIVSHVPKKKQTINVKLYSSDKFKIVIYEVDERVILLFEAFFRIFKSNKSYFFLIKLFSLLKKLLFILKITKGYYPIYILKKII